MNKSEEKFPTVDQNLVEIRWWSSAFMLRDYLREGVCDKHKNYWSDKTKAIVCDDEVLEEYMIPTENQVLDAFRKLIEKYRKKKSILVTKDRY